MGKAIILVMLFLLVGIVTAVNFDYIYNPYMGRLDRSISLNQSGDNITADYFFGDGSSLTGVSGAANETAKVTKVVATNCTGQVIAMFNSDGTGVCEADNAAAGGAALYAVDTTGTYISVNLSLSGGVTDFNSSFITADEGTNITGAGVWAAIYYMAGAKLADIFRNLSISLDDEHLHSCNNMTGGQGDFCTINDTIDDKLVTTFFNATSIAVINGTGQGVIGDLQNYNEVSYNVSEVDSDFDLRINFTGVTGINQLIYRYKTETGEPHTMHTQVWDYIAGAWEGYAEEGAREHFGIFTYMVFDEEKHLSGELVQVRFYTTNDPPNTVHKWQFDWVIIADGLATPSSSESDPFSVHRGGTTPMTGNWNQGLFNFTNQLSWFFGWVNASKIVGKIFNTTEEMIAATTGKVNSTAWNATDGIVYTGSNVGIGMENPEYLLHIEENGGGKTVNISGVLYINGTSGRMAIGWPSGPHVGALSIMGAVNIHSTVDSLRKILFAYASGDGFINIYDDSENLDIQLYADNPSYFMDSLGIGTTTPSEKLSVMGNVSLNNTLYVLENGKVGIGTKNPNAPLEIVGAVQGDVGGFPSGELQIRGDDTAQFYNSVITGHNSFNTNTQLWYLGSNSGSNNDIAFINRQDANLFFFTNNTKRMIIDNTGNVGIGTTSPTTKLDVAGTVNATAMKTITLNATGTSYLNLIDGTALNLVLGCGNITGGSDGDYCVDDVGIGAENETTRVNLIIDTYIPNNQTAALAYTDTHAATKHGNTTAEIAGVKVDNATYADDTSLLGGADANTYLDDTTIGNCTGDGSCSLIVYYTDLGDYANISNLIGNCSGNECDIGWGNLTSIPTDIADGDADTTYTADEVWLYESSDVFYFNRTYSDSQYFNRTDTATPADGETKISTATQIYNWVIGLVYATTSYVDTVIAGIGNWTEDKGDYYTITLLDANFSLYTKGAHTPDTTIANETPRMNDIYDWVTENATGWDTAYEWGDHSTAGYYDYSGISGENITSGLVDESYIDSAITREVDLAYIGNCSGADCDIGWGNLSSVPTDIADGDDYEADTTIANETTRVDIIYPWLDQSVLTTSQPKFAGINSTGDINMTTNDITTVNCIIFESGGRICSGT